MRDIQKLTVDELVEEYKTGEDVLPQKEKALLEEEIWKKMYDPVNREERRDVLKTLLGVTTAGSEARSALLRAGTDVDLLWPLVDSKIMRIGQAQEVYKFAKRTHELSPHISKAEIVGKIVEEFKKSPKCRLSTIRFRAFPNLNNTPVSGPSVNGAAWDPDAAFFKEFRKRLNSHLASRMVGVHDLTVQTMQKEVESMVNDLLRDISGKIYRAVKQDRGGARPEIAISIPKQWKELGEACSILELPMPKRGMAVHEAKLKLKRRAYTKLYHPDNFVGAKEESRLEAEKYFASINHAFDVVKAYNESLRREDAHDGNE